MFGDALIAAAVGAVAVAYVATGGLVGLLAGQMRRNGAFWTLISLFLTPVLTLVVLAFMGYSQDVSSARVQARWELAVEWERKELLRRQAEREQRRTAAGP